MIGIARRVVVGLVARGAGRWSALILAILVTGLAGSGAMGPGQAESRIVIKGGSLPLPFRVARIACRWKARGQVIWSRCGFKVGLMTREAILGRVREMSILVARLATGRGVSVGQRKKDIVVEKRASLEVRFLPDT